MASVAIRDVRKAFGATEVIHGVSVLIGDGEFVVLVGPSGCGKSTLLRMIAGLENITTGEISIGERVVNHVPPKERDIAMVFQNYALYPHMTVAANMSFSLKLRGAPLELSGRPQNLFVAGFIGSPAMNFLKGTIRANGQLQFESDGGVPLPLAGAPKASNGRKVVYGIRPEHFVIADDGAEAQVQVIEPTGSELNVVAKLGGADIIAVFRERHSFQPGDKIRLKPDPRLGHLFYEASG